MVDYSAELRAEGSAAESVGQMAVWMAEQMVAWRVGSTVVPKDVRWAAQLAACWAYSLAGKTAVWSALTTAAEKVAV
jgi:hypothetical protein